MNVVAKVWKSNYTLGLFLFCVLFLKFLYDFWYWLSETKNVSKYLLKNEVLLLNYIKTQKEDIANQCSKESGNILNTQFDQLSGIKAQAYDILVTTTAYNYACLSNLLISSIFTALFLFFIGKDGFNNAKPSYKFAFIVLVALSLYTGLSVQVLKHDENISYYIDSYNKASGLQQEIFNYAATSCSYDLSDTTSLNEKRFITKMNRKISDLKVVNFSLDPVKSTDITERLNSYVQ